MGAACFKQYPEAHVQAEKLMKEGKRQKENEVKLLLLGLCLFFYPCVEKGAYGAGIKCRCWRLRKEYHCKADEDYTSAIVVY
jgi:hypothetical protein